MQSIQAEITHLNIVKDSDWTESGSCRIQKWPVVHTVRITSDSSSSCYTTEVLK